MSTVVNAAVLCGSPQRWFGRVSLTISGFVSLLGILMCCETVQVEEPVPPMSKERHGGIFGQLS